MMEITAIIVMFTWAVYLFAARVSDKREERFLTAAKRTDMSDEEFARRVRLKLTEPIRFEHDGYLLFECQLCGASGRQRFENLATKTREPRQADYLEVLARAETEHSLDGCNGRLESGGAVRTKTVERFA